MSAGFTDRQWDLLSAAFWIHLHRNCNATCVNAGNEGGLCADDRVRLAFLSGLTGGRIETWDDLFPLLMEWQIASPEARAPIERLLKEKLA